MDEIERYGDRNPIQEYYDLKQMLCLTDEERYCLITRNNAENIIVQLLKYKKLYNVTIGVLADRLKIHRISLGRIFSGKETPSDDTKSKILELLEGYR